MEAKPKEAPVESGTAAPTLAPGTGFETGGSPRAPSPYPVLTSDPELKIQPWAWRTIGDLTWPLTPDSEFDALYPPGMDSGELADLGYEKMEQFGQQLTALGLAQFASGDYESLSMPLPKMERGPERGAVHVQVSRYVELKGQPPEGFRGLPQHCERPDLTTGQVHIAWIRYRDHPQLYRLQEEALYLIRRGNKP